MIGIDTSVLIDAMRNKEAKDKLLNYSGEDLVTSEIVVYELLYGLYASVPSKKMLYELEEVLDIFIHIFPIDRKASIKAAQIAGRLSKSGRIIGHSDILIAGSLIANGCSRLLTKNTKDFGRIRELEIAAY